MEMRTARRRALPGENNYHKSVLAYVCLLLTTVVGCIGSGFFPSRPSSPAVVSEQHELALLTAFSEQGITAAGPMLHVTASPPQSSTLPELTTLTHTVTPSSQAGVPLDRPALLVAHATPASPAPQPSDQTTVVTGTVQQGQTAVVLFRNASIDSSQALAMWRAVRKVYDIQRLRVGQPYTIHRAPQGQLHRFTYDIDGDRRFVVERQQQSFVGHITSLPTQDDAHHTVEQPQPSLPPPNSTPKKASAATAPPRIRPSSQPTTASVVMTGKVKRGQTATTLFAQAGVSEAEVIQLRRAVRRTYDIRLLRAGHTYAIQATLDGHLQRFTYDITTRRRLNVERHTTAFTSRITRITPGQSHPALATASGTTPQPTAPHTPKAVTPHQRTATAPPQPTPTVTTAPPQSAPSSTALRVTTGTVKSGQNAVSIFSQAGVDSKQVVAMRRAIRRTYDIRRLHVGHAYSIAVDADGNLQRFTYDLSDQKRLEVDREGTRFVSKRTSIPYESYERVIHGRIAASIYATLVAQGESPRLVRNLADIFAWKVDFPTDLRQGDAFRLLIEERARKGELPHYHRILAAELVNQNDVLQAVYYTKQGEYYQPNGRSLRGIFLRSPLRYRRISSHFSRRRLHPILKRYRPHWGIDYAAPRGTPVRTVGDGVVKWAGRKGQNGKLITIRHNSVYTSHYLHLSRYARGIKHGARVKQGQIIGYVGSTGLATGPHLDFRLSKHGRYVNPLTHKSVAAPGIPKRKLSAFRRFAKQQLAKLRQAEPGRSQRVASTQGQE